MSGKVCIMRPVPVLPVAVVVKSVLEQSLSSETTDVPHGRKWWTGERTDGQGTLLPFCRNVCGSIAQVTRRIVARMRRLHPDRLQHFLECQTQSIPIAERTTPGTPPHPSLESPATKAAAAARSCHAATVESPAPNNTLERSAAYEMSVLLAQTVFAACRAPLRFGNEPVTASLHGRNQIHPCSNCGPIQIRQILRSVAIANEPNVPEAVRRNGGKRRHSMVR
jgi:hypothetical protein